MKFAMLRSILGYRLLLALSMFACMLCLAACATKNEWHNTNSNANLEADEAHCDRVVRQSALPDQGNALFQPMRNTGPKADLYSRCMLEKGWYKVKNESEQKTP
ncbi:hypothetical protein G6672_05125 [Polynucleobacter paneuropaeus]|jgi:hypothetical protein|nr:hypothetical protein [Polynucleobacter paneuropaeus]AWW44841.1 hypothetical protein DPM16_06150 [Polynucleobacter paneuropaeus]MBT8522192.1 hypothetical protein [Polynucleobacter paneuropaeus]MBT8528575.1 hypothetical protein [Polynucleobacter paneuropaeus]MBT8536349.1 hypothetical protein [Polynucleobacter paneuropaeus]MBT8543177.1 hypothetical protein [Polynucleobacter paneuropaeus]